MEHWLEIFITVAGSVLASSGFWTLIVKRGEKKDDKTKMLLGLAHDRIVTLGMSYISRGYILQEEYDDLYTYLWEPYHHLGGNGSAERIMKELQKLPIYQNHIEAQQHLGGQNEARN